MNWQYRLVTILNILSVLTSFYVVIVATKQRPSKEQNRFLLAMYCLVLITIGGYFEGTARSVETAVLAVKTGYVGRIFSMLLLPRFVFEYCHMKNLARIRTFVWLINCFLLGIIITCDNNTLFYKSYQLDLTGSFPVFRVEPGILYYPALVEMYMLLLFLLTKMIPYFFVRKNSMDRKRNGVIILSVLLPFVGLCFYTVGMTGGYDPLPLCMSISGILFVVAIQKFYLFDIEQNAKDYVFDHSKEAVLVIDNNGEIIYNNQFFEEKFGINEAELSHRIEEWILSEDMEFQLHDESYHAYRTQICRDDGKKEGYLIEIRNVTQIKKICEEMDGFRKDAERANRAKSSFLANMSHEIRTPINAILGMDEMILRECEEPNILEYADSIGLAGTELLKLVNHILDYSKVESGKQNICIERYETNDLLSLFFEDMDRMNSINDRLKITVNNQLPTVMYGDRNKYIQLFKTLMEIMENVYENGEVGVFITFSYKCNKNDAVVQYQYPFVYLQFVLRFEEPATNPKIRDRAFEIFQNRSDSTLDIVRDNLEFAIIEKFLANLHGFLEIKVDSQNCDQYIVNVPQGVIDERGIGEIQYRSEKKNAKQQNPLLAPEARILVVDDNSVNLKVITGLLKQTKIQVQTVRNGVEALEYYQNEEYDVIFMDHLMPNMDGIQTFRKMQEMSEAVSYGKPVIILTANAIDGAREMYLSEGFKDYLMKPVESRRLEEVLRVFLPREKLVT